MTGVKINEVEALVGITKKNIRFGSSAVMQGAAEVIATVPLYN